MTILLMTLTPAITELEAALQTYETNFPIQRRKRNKSRNRFFVEKIAALKDAILILRGSEILQSHS